jgi:Ca2+-binding RTX toxin-like protein
VVEDFASGSFGKYSAWGEITGSNGVPVKFCCIETNTNVEDFELIGTGGTDTLKLNDGTHDLRGARGGLLGALVRGESGDDAIEGSRESSSLYMAEELRGGPGSDTIRGRAGDDRICGGVCGAGSDSADYMSGGPGDDELIGDAGADLMCDTSGADAFYGNDGDDDMYSSSATTPTGDGGAGTNECGDSDLYTAWATSCSDTIATEPGSCPLP